MNFGTDPEYLITTLLGRPVPAHTLGFGNKDHKKTLVSSGGDGWESRAFRDGYMLEVNVQPSTCRQTLTYRVQRALRALKKSLPVGYKLVPKPAVKINLQKDMKGAPADVLQFGCEPSLCAYELEEKRPVIDAIDHPYRYAGGHLHFGYYPSGLLEWMLDKDKHPRFIKLCDRYIGVPLTYLFDSKATFLRRRFYGQAGEYRSQQYGKDKKQVGVEYRTPGPEVWNAPWVASYALGVGRYIAQNFKDCTLDKTMNDDIRAAIDTGEGVEKLLKFAILPKYRESVDVRKLKQYAPRTCSLMTLRTTSGAVDRGFYEWAESRHLIEG